MTTPGDGVDGGPLAGVVTALRRKALASDNTWSDRDLEHARAVLGYAPQDRAEDYR